MVQTSLLPSADQVTLVTIGLNRGASIRGNTHYYAGRIDVSCWREFCLYTALARRPPPPPPPTANGFPLPAFAGTSSARMTYGWPPWVPAARKRCRSNDLVIKQVKERAAREVADEGCVDVGSARGRLRCGVTLGERSGHTGRHRPRPRYRARRTYRSIRRRGRSWVPQRPVGLSRRPRGSRRKPPGLPPSQPPPRR